MKKLLIALTILAVASVAQAELLATWTFDAGASSVATEAGAANIGQVTFGELTRVVVGQSGTSSGQFASNNWGTEGNGVSLAVTVASGYEIANTVIGVGGVNGSNTGPGTLQWSLGYTGGTSFGTDVGDAWTVAYSSGSSVAADVAVGTIDSGANTLFLRSTGGQVATPTGTPATAGSARLHTNLTMGGDIQTTAIPEPATMSLLGLGALAMVLRRKIRK
ncbi:MAG: PEP-CTERM sorting domain-containing protein [Kiritimatiellae bacterium]|nr:PEP-CTERM sorting domain-containing protein [Kiritimatiellia bacterium]MDD2239906.1 PEP-CTERM sorting domain-containing protein [Kiritimatiellia bacterium]